MDFKSQTLVGAANRGHAKDCVGILAELAQGSAHNMYIYMYIYIYIYIYILFCISTHMPQPLSAYSPPPPPPHTSNPYNKESQKPKHPSKSQEPSDQP